MTYKIESNSVKTTQKQSKPFFPKNNPPQKCLRNKSTIFDKDSDREIFFSKPVSKLSNAEDTSKTVESNNVESPLPSNYAKLYEPLPQKADQDFKSYNHHLLNYQPSFQAGYTIHKSEEFSISSIAGAIKNAILANNDTVAPISGNLAAIKTIIGGLLFRFYYQFNGGNLNYLT